MRCFVGNLVFNAHYVFFWALFQRNPRFLSNYAGFRLLSLFNLVMFGLNMCDFKCDLLLEGVL